MTGNEYKLNENDKISYLNMLQNVITPMAGNSAIMKGFAATIIVGVFGLTVTDIVKWYYIVVALIPMISFVCLDVYYLKLEKSYRNLYELIAKPDTEINHNYSLNLKNKAFENYKNIINENTSILQLIMSHSVIGFYSWFIITGLFCIIIA